jgi:hypothetical protein
LKSHRSWIKQDALRKSEIEDSSSSKYVSPHRRHIKGKGNVTCKNANYNSAENAKKHSNKRSLPTYHHRSHLTQMSTASGLEVEGSEGATNKSTSSILPPTSLQAPQNQHQHQFVFTNQSGKSKKNNSSSYKRKPQKPISNHGYEGLLSLMQCMLRRMDNMNKTCKPPPRVKQVWVRNDETIYSLRGSGLT